MMDLIKVNITNQPTQISVIHNENPIKQLVSKLLYFIIAILFIYFCWLGFQILRNTLQVSLPGINELPTGDPVITVVINSIKQQDDNLILFTSQKGQQLPPIKLISGGKIFRVTAQKILPANFSDLEKSQEVNAVLINKKSKPWTTNKIYIQQ